MMKKVVSITLALLLLFSLAACGGGTAPPVAPPQPEAPVTQPQPEPPKPDDPPEEVAQTVGPWKIAYVSNTVDQNEEEYRAGEALVAKYGEDKIIHRTWPVRFAEEAEQMVTTLKQLAADPDIRGLVMNQAVVNTNNAVDAFIEELGARRPEVFIVYCSPAEAPEDITARANLVLNSNDPAIGPIMARQAQALGATKFAHYSFPRHMGIPTLALRKENIIEECARIGLEFIDLTCLDPMGPDGMAGAVQYIMEDVPKQVAAHGVDTAFFNTNCGMQVPLQTQVIATGAIYPQPCDPSPYHGFPLSLGITAHVPTGEMRVNDAGDEVEVTRMRSIPEVLEETKAKIAEAGMTGRVSNWAVPGTMMWGTSATEYIIKWINGEVPKDGLDYDAFEQVCRTYIFEMTGQNVGVQFETLNYKGRDLKNYFVGIVDYITY